MQGTTDALLALANATRANKAWHGAWSALRQRHLDAASALDPGDVHGLCAEIEDELEGLHRTLVALAAGDPDAESAAPGLPGLGEVLSSRLMRSEEHTSELQSLMRISYAVFCLKQKHTNIHITSYKQTPNEMIRR